MKLHVLFITLFFCAAITTAYSQTPTNKLNAWLDNEAGDMGGRAILMVYKDGKVIYNHSVNKMNMRQKLMNRMIAKRQGKTADPDDYTPASREAIASCSKWLSAALVMTFVDEGKLKLTDTVGKFLPALTAGGKGNITIGQCLSHQTGIKPLPLKDDLEEMRNTSNMDEAMQNIAKLPMEGQPGKVFHYSNVGLQIAGAVIEKIGGKTFQALFAERIAKPLDMQNTDWGTAKVALPAGGAISTPQDYLNFLVMILNKGTYNGKRILSEASIAQMQVNRITADVKVAYSPAEAGSLGYGYGEWVSKTDDNKGWPISSPGLFGSFPWVDYKNGYAAILMTFYINNQGRGERYKALKGLVDELVK
ncbi:beta-lactamase family protein [Mucilaginibacter sp. S1162]|uniref:Beta-lactamase family protein n=1 Tax=Mucilaginibacter humi TaxID=2732510 RepID=A0ABX1W2I3_9SPHI|nr:serine hydrolase domain-containing protein [Mucilaginibacter humi]NNU33861.1 beta-lactamase family protein [Mucilaginibacter humi]